MKNFYIMIVIDYVNGLLYLGYVYEKVLMDVIVRFWWMMGDNVYFLIGVDEYG